MQYEPVARVYAQALLDIAREQQRIDAVGEALASVAAAARSDSVVKTFLETPALDAGAKKRALGGLRGTLDECVVNFLCLLVDKGRIGQLDSIALAYRDLADEAGGRTRVQAVTARPIDAATRQQVEGAVRDVLGRQCVLETEVRPDLLGGLVLQVGDKIYDGSVRGRLRRMHTVMTRSSGL